ncbi:MAG: exo-beta-N-acetylmuramidase NamZ domain-containing protein, partial [Deinococcales bacterium]
MTGLERLILDPKPLGRAALYTNHTGVTSDFTPAAIALNQAGMKIEKLFAPEHGIDGSGKEGEAPAVQTDKASGLPVITLYDKTSS